MFEEPPSFQDVSIGQEIAYPHEETQAKKEQDRLELHEQEDPHTKKILTTLEDEEKVANDKVYKETLQWEIQTIKQTIK